MRGCWQGWHNPPMPKCTHCLTEKPQSEFASIDLPYWFSLGCRPCFWGMWIGDGSGNMWIHKNNPLLKDYQKKGPATASTVAGPSKLKPPD